MRGKRWLTAVPCLLMGGYLMVALLPSTAAATARVYPNVDISGGWNLRGDDDGSCVGDRCTRLDEVTPTGDDGIRTGNSGGQKFVTLGMGTIDIEEGATQIVVNVYGRSVTLNQGGEADGLTVELFINGVFVGSQTNTPNYSVSTTQTATFSGTWNQSDIDSVEIRLVSVVRGALGQDNLEVGALSADVTYTETPELEQAAYRFYQNPDSTTPGTPLATNNTVAESPNTDFRLRMLLHVSGSTLATGQTFKLQYAEKSGSCDTAFSGESYSDVSTSTGAIRWSNNNTPSDGAAIGTTANDPDHSGHTKVAQTYEEANTFSNPNQVPASQDGMWDFSLRKSAVPAGSSYCFRVVYGDGSSLESYTQIPEVTITGGLLIAVLDADGFPVANPSISFTPSTVAQACGITYGTLGTSTQKLRVINDLVTNGWSVSMAATTGSGALWSSGTPKYDFNDPAGSPAGCSAGLDSDTYAGQLTVDPSSTTITPEAGCSNTGLTLGSNASYNEDVVDAISLVNASSASSRFCYWEIGDIGLYQIIPGAQPAGTYGIDITITVVAN